MGYGEAIRSVDRIAWPEGSGLNNAKPRSEGRQLGAYNPSEAKTTGEALSYIDFLHKSGRTEDLAKLLRKSQVFRAAWLMVQQSSSDVCTAGEGNRSFCRGGTREATHLPVPASGLPRLTFEPAPGSPGPEVPRVADTESCPQTPAAGMALDDGGEFFDPRFQSAHPLGSLLQVYQNQACYGARAGQRGQLVNIWA